MAKDYGTTREAMKAYRGPSHDDAGHDGFRNG